MKIAMTVLVAGSALCAISGVASASPFLQASGDGFADNDANFGSASWLARARNLESSANTFESFLGNGGAPSSDGVDDDINWGPSTATGSFSLSYDGSQATWTINAATGSGVSTLTYDVNDDFNLISLTLKADSSDDDASVTLNNLTLNGTNFGTFSADHDGTNSREVNYAMFAGFGNAFTITGDFAISWVGSLRQEDIAFDFKMSNGTVIPLPAASAMAGLGFVLVGTHRRRLR